MSILLVVGLGDRYWKFIIWLFIELLFGIVVFVEVGDLGSFVDGFKVSFVECVGEVFCDRVF